MIHCIGTWMRLQTLTTNAANGSSHTVTINAPVRAISFYGSCPTCTSGGRLDNLVINAKVCQCKLLPEFHVPTYQIINLHFFILCICVNIKYDKVALVVVRKLFSDHCKLRRLLNLNKTTCTFLFCQRVNKKDRFLLLMSLVPAGVN